MSQIPRWSVALSLLVLIACDPPAPVAPVEPVVVAPPPPIEKVELDAAEDHSSHLVPSPAETQRAMENMGIATGISKLVRERKLDMATDNKDVVAVRTGVALADCLLTLKDAEKPKLIERLELVRSGMNALGAGGNVNMTLEDLIARVTNDSASRDDLLRDLDEMHNNIIPEIEFQTGGDRFIPLMQAGSWLEGSNLVSRAILEAGKPDAGTNLLRQPKIVAYFLGYVKDEGAAKAPQQVLVQLQKTLRRLEEISAKEAFTADDVKEIEIQTDAVLGML